MKKFFKFAAILAAMFVCLSCFVACGGNNNDPGVTTPSVDTPSIDDVEKSGATKVVKSEEEVKTVIASMASDPAIAAVVDVIKDAIEDIDGNSSKSENRQAYAKADTSELEKIIKGYSEKIEKFSNDIDKNGKGSFSIDDKITEVDLGDDFNKWLAIKGVVLKLKADGSADESKMAIKADGEVAAKTEIKVKKLAENSGFGTITCNFDVKAAGDVKVSMTEDDENYSGNISASTAIAIAFPYVDDSTGLGGRFVITYDASGNADLEKAMKLEKEDEIMDYVKKNCKVTLVIKVFDDAGKESYTDTMNLEDILKIVEDMMEEE